MNNSYNLKMGFMNINKLNNNNYLENLYKMILSDDDKTNKLANTILLKNKDLLYEFIHKYFNHCENINLYFDKNLEVFNNIVKIHKIRPYSTTYLLILENYQPLHNMAKFLGINYDEL